jgi:hypothetical protein
MNRSDRPHVLELKIPPGVLVVITGALMWLVATATPAAALVILGRSLGTVVLMLIGVVISGLGFSNPKAYGLLVDGNSSATSSNWWR